MELSQNLKALLQEIGESSVLLQLCMRLRMNKEWSVYRNYAGHGHDLVLVGPRKQIAIEIKTRQNVIKRRERRTSLHFILSAKECEAAQFVVAYWFDKAAYFVIPTSELRPYRSGQKTMHRFVAYYSNVEGDYTSHSKKYYDAWHFIDEAIKADTTRPEQAA